MCVSVLDVWRDVMCGSVVRGRGLYVADHECGVVGGAVTSWWVPPSLQRPPVGGGGGDAGMEGGVVRDVGGVRGRGRGQVVGWR